MTAETSLFEQFLRQECTPDVRALVCAAVATDVDRVTKRTFEFNRFNLILDFTLIRATVEDVLDASEAGSVSMSIPELQLALVCPPANEKQSPA